MSRRPLAPFEIQENVAIDRMVAGGRRWSESPIARPGWRRPRMRGSAVVPVAPTFVDRDQWIPYTETSFEIHDGGVNYSPAFGTFDKALCWVFCFTTTFTPPSGWTTLASGTHNGIQYWIGWVDNAGAGTDWTLTFAAAPGYPLGYRTTHVWCEYLSGGNMTPEVMDFEALSDVSSHAAANWDPSAALVRQACWMHGEGYVYGRVAAPGYSDYNYTCLYGSAGVVAIRDFWEYGAGLRPNGTYSWYTDSARTIPHVMDSSIRFAVGWT